MNQEDRTIIQRNEKKEEVKSYGKKTKYANLTGLCEMWYRIRIPSAKFKPQLRFIK